VFSGGTILDQVLSLKGSPIEVENLTVTVRSEQQIKALSDLGVHTIALDLKDEEAVKKAVLSNNGRLTKLNAGWGRAHA
jgi:hypothetical protein